MTSVHGGERVDAKINGTSSPGYFWNNMDHSLLCSAYLPASNNDMQKYTEKTSNRHSKILILLSEIPALVLFLELSYIFDW